MKHFFKVNEKMNKRIVRRMISTCVALVMLCCAFLALTVVDEDRSANILPFAANEVIAHNVVEIA